MTDNISPVMEDSYQIDEKNLLNNFDRLNALLEQDNADIKIDITIKGMKISKSFDKQ